MEFKIYTKPLSVNQYYATNYSNRGQKIYITAKGKEYREGIVNGLKESNITKFAGEINLEINLLLGKKRKMDVDNCLKPLLDAFEGILYDNDSQIYSLKITKDFGYREDAIKVKASQHIFGSK